MDDSSQDPPVRVETPESRMTGEGGRLPPEQEKRKGPEDGPEYEVTDPVEEPRPHGRSGRPGPPDR
ncbi:hypothetical protein ACIRS1_19235 [Kitasatospora sp. NPDC101176]|uniref:hypothetical protein n=1 Tax=Kitasatospora sp. NPDC101176 TaxID=3364099 RepID=UPI00380022CD